MKFLFLTDSHLSNRRPSSRIDDYPQTVLNKFRDVVDLARQHDVEAVIHGGDVFHSPAVDRDLAGAFAEIVRDLPCPMYIVPGNHDLFGQNVSTLPHTMLGLLIRSGVLRLLDREQIIESDDCVIEGQPYYPRIDRDHKDADYGFRTQTSKTKILVAHGLILPSPMLPDVPVTLPDEIPAGADLILVGHYHPGFKTFSTPSGVEVVNPGSLTRTDASTNEIQRDVKALLRDDDGSLIPLPIPSAEPGNMVLSRASTEIHQQRQDTLTTLQESLRQLQSHKTSFHQILKGMIHTSTSDVQTCVSDILTQVEKTAQNDPQPMPADRRIVDTVILKDFQSHENTCIDFVDGLNAIVGPSDQGKTAVMRAVRWAFYNEPKRGSDAFVRTGQDEAHVAVEFSDGAQLQRNRSAGKRSSGEYHITKAGEAESELLTGFGSGVPPEIGLLSGHAEIELASGVNRRILIADQHEGAFFLSETAPAKAAVLGKLSGTDQADEAIKLLMTEHRDDQRRIKQIDTELEEITAQLQQFETLDEEIRLQKHLSSQLTEIKQRAHHLDLLDDILALIQTAAADIKRAEAVLEELPNTNQSELLLQETIDKHLIYQDIQQITETIRRLNQQINQAEAYLQSTQEIPMCDELLDAIPDQLRQLDALHELAVEYQTLVRSYREATVSIRGLDEQLDTMTRHFTDVLQAQGVCPTCDRPFDEATIEQMKEVI